MHNPAILTLISLEHDRDLERMKETLRTLGIVPAEAAPLPIVSRLTGTVSAASSSNHHWITLAGQIATARAARGLPLTRHTLEPGAGASGKEPCTRGFTVRIHSRITLMEPTGAFPVQRQT